MDRRKALASIGLSAFAGALMMGCSREELAAQSQPTTAGTDPSPAEEDIDDGLVDLLFVQNAFGMAYDGSKLTLIDVDPKTLFFSDRPDDVAGFLRFDEFIKLVSDGPDSFQEDPPNASFMIFGDNNIEQAVVTITARPIVEGNKLVYPSLEIIEGQLPAEGGANALFIDVIGRPMSPTSVAGVHRRHRRRRRRHAVRNPGPG